MVKQVGLPFRLHGLCKTAKLKRSFPFGGGFTFLSTGYPQHWCFYPRVIPSAIYISLAQVARRIPAKGHYRHCQSVG
jgi:hypothetical protein